MITEALAAHARGWSLTPLNGKIPVLKGWTTREPPTEEDLRRWVERGDNLGLRTGSASGVFVIDVEADHDGGLGLPLTPTVRTGSGGRHYYFNAPTPCPGNTAKLLGEDIDTRGEGGQVVYPGSIHPETGEPYSWYVTPEEAPLADLPPEILDRLMPRERAPYVPVEPGPGADAWASAALEREVQAVASTPRGCGRAHHQMTKSAYKLGQVAGAGLLAFDVVVDQLVAAAISAGEDEKEARRVLFQCAEAGRSNPRGPVPAGLDDLVLVEATTKHETPTVLVPGAHKLAGGEYVEVPNDAFSEAVLSCMHDIYRRDLVPGRVDGSRFVQLNDDDFRRVCDPPRVRLARWCTTKRGKEGTKQSLVFENCTPANARLIRSRAAQYARQIKLLTPYPVLVGSKISPPGFEDGVFYAGEAIEPTMDRTTIRETLDDLVVDFPFEDESSRQNFLGLLLTPMLRPLCGKVPLHLITSPQPGTGKSRLVEEVFGAVYLGEPLSSSSLPERTEERAKWLTALLLSGQTLVHLDNLTDELDSANLASLVTSAHLSDRLLGSSTFLRLENQLTLAATGNNTQLSSELARRTVVVRLIWRGEGRPDERMEFQHAPEYALERREAVLAALAGACLTWSGNLGTRPLGSFERWAGVVGGVLADLGYGDHLGNRERWREATDSQEAALGALVAAWRERWGDQPIGASQLHEGCYAALQGVVEKPSVVGTGKLLARMVDSRVGGWRIVACWGESRRRAYRLEE